MNNEKLKKIMKELVDNHEPSTANEYGVYYEAKFGNVRLSVNESRKEILIVIHNNSSFAPSIWQSIKFDNDTEWHEYTAKVSKLTEAMQNRVLDQIFKDITTPTEVSSDFDTVQNDIIDGKEED